MPMAPEGPAYTFTGDSNEEYAAHVVGRLQAFNRAHIPTDSDPAPLEIYILDDAGSLVGGLVGKTVWGWLEIAAIWVEERLRGRGLGTELMECAETEARRRGCAAARFSTWDFQALGFYERLGYTPYGRLENYPAGHTVYYLRKELTE
jgi:ribosomal protein S18 acetylase RimI-like enzyme